MSNKTVSLEDHIRKEEASKARKQILGRTALIPLYPILGFFPGEARDKIKGWLGNEFFSSDGAYYSSLFLAPVVYGALGYYTGRELSGSNEGAAFFGVSGAALGIIDSWLRLTVQGENEESKYKPGSYFGAVAFSPIILAGALGIGIGLGAAKVYNYIMEPYRKMKKGIDEVVQKRIAEIRTRAYELREKFEPAEISKEESAKLMREYVKAMNSEDRGLVKSAFESSLANKYFNVAGKLAEKLGKKQVAKFRGKFMEVLEAEIEYLKMPPEIINGFPAPDYRGIEGLLDFQPDDVEVDKAEQISNSVACGKRRKMEGYVN